MSIEFFGKNLKIQGNKTTLAIALILILTVSAFIAIMPAANAHTPPWDVPTWCYIGVSPNPVGVNQQVLVVFWLDKPPMTAVGAYGDRWTFNVEVTKPDGGKENLGPFTSDPVGSGYTMYTPSQLGTYSFVSSFPGLKMTGQPAPPPGQLTQGTEYINDTAQPSKSKPVLLTVQQQPVEGWSEASVPAEYWTRPINNMNRGWWQISGNWLAGSSVVGRTNLFTEGPETGHIVWTRPIWEGGVAGGQYGDLGYFTGLAYENRWAPPIIMNGKVYYNVLNPPRYGYYCLDLRSGEEVWFKNSTGALQISRQSALNPANTSGNYPQLAFGQIYDFESPNEHGTFSYLWITVGTTWQMYDSFTGNWICNIANVPSGTAVTSSDGSLLRYVLGTNKRWIACWNSSLAIIHRDPYYANEYWLWRPTLGTTFSGANGYSWNKSLAGLPSDAFVLGYDNDAQVLILTNGLILGPHVGMGSPPPTYTQVGVSLKPETAGQVLWTKTRNALPGNLTINYGAAGSGIYTMSTKETMEWYAYSSTTGEQLWGPTTPQDSWDMYGLSCSIAYGKVFGYGYAGQLYAYDATTGKVMWIYNASNIGSEAPYTNFPLSLGSIAEGKLYMYSTEHSPSMPLTRGYMLRCVNASNGVELWKMSHWGSGPAIADGYIVDLDLYDNNIYCYGKGQTATTANASPRVAAIGTPLLIDGTVTDQSPGQTALGIPAAGTPAISDEGMSAWMQYLYKQQLKPTNVTGVKVHLTAIDPNGNFQDLGTATSDDSGFYSLMWTPPVSGKYVVTASFEGSESYYPSSTKTAFGVSAAASAAPVVNPTTVPTAAPTQTVAPQTSTPVQSVSPSPSPAVQPPTSGMPTTTYIAIGAAVVIIAVVAAAVVLRRRK